MYRLSFQLFSVRDAASARVGRAPTSGVRGSRRNPNGGLRIRAARGRPEGRASLRLGWGGCSEGEVSFACELRATENWSASSFFRFYSVFFTSPAWSRVSLVTRPSYLLGSKTHSRDFETDLSQVVWRQPFTYFTINWPSHCARLSRQRLLCKALPTRFNFYQSSTKIIVSCTTRVIIAGSSP